MKRTCLATLTALFLCVIPMGIHVEASTWTIPGIANVAGANNTHFVSDLAITNPGNTPVAATLTFLPEGLPPVAVTLGANQTVAYRNILQQLWGVSLGGAVQVSSDSMLLLRARTYNDATSGTYGVALPVFASDRLLSAGETADSVWVNQSAEFRTNIAVVFPDAGGGTATVTIFDADGNQVGQRDYGLDVPGFQQISVSSFAGAVPVGRAELVVTSGRAAGYSVVVDNVTGDSSLFSFEDLPAGYQDVLVNGVARAPGSNATFFRTDGRFYNPASQDAEVTVAFHANQGSNTSPVTGTFIVPAGKIRDVVDVLGSLLGLPVGGGALRFSSAFPVAILCRTSNVDPTGVRRGTYGAQQTATQLLSFLMSADEGAMITGIRQNAAFRTNIGFAAGEDGASYALTLRNTSGATVATATGSLGPFGFAQPNVQGLFAGTAIPDDATLQVKVTSGSVDIYDSSNDNSSGDPVVTPIMRVPVNVPSLATIGPDGGSIRSSDGVLTLKVPAGALSAPVTIALTQAPNDAPGGVGSGYDISPDGLAFAKPALLGLTYGPGALDVPRVDGLALAFPSGTSWAGLTGGRINTSARTLTISLPNTSPSAASPLPVELKTGANAGTSRIVTVTGFEVIVNAYPINRAWVPTDGKATVLAFFRLPPSSSGKEPAHYLISQLNLDPRNVTFFPPKIGTISRESADSAIYTAPHSISSASVPVLLRVWAVVTHGAGVPFGTYEAVGTFHVVRRRWLMNVEFEIDIPCEGEEGFSYKYSDDQTQTFRVEDSLFVTADPFLAGLPNDSELKGCGKCSGTLLAQPGTVAFSFRDRSLLVSDAQAWFLISGKAEIVIAPAIQVVCPDGTFTTPPINLALDLSQLGKALRPNDKTRITLQQGPLGKIVVQWRSIAD